VVVNSAATPRPATLITQTVYPVPQALKAALLVRLLGHEIDDALVFTRTKHRADRLARHLARAGVATERIHGNRSQAQRTQALSGFKKGTYRVLVATDIAARGIDIVGLGHVVNFDVPMAAEDYVHRVGRTGRAQAAGAAFTLVSPEEDSDLRAIERTIGSRIPRVTMPDFEYGLRPQPADVERHTREVAGEPRHAVNRTHPRHRSFRASEQPTSPHNRFRQRRPAGRSRPADR
jgi:ATP-dependent RNA helicase RhlE